MEKDRKRVLQLQEKWVVPFFVAVLEAVFHLAVYGKLDGNILHGILFSIPFSFFVLFISSTGNAIWNRISRGLSLLAAVIYFAAQLMYHQVFGNFLSIKSVANGAGQAMDFLPSVMEALKENALVIGCMIGLWAVLTGAGFFFEKIGKRRETACNEERTAGLFDWDVSDSNCGNLHPDAGGNRPSQCL